MPLRRHLRASSLLIAAALGLFVVSCPEFPESALNYETGPDQDKDEDDQCRDRDGDGVLSCEGDCDDGQRDIFPEQEVFFDQPLGPRRFDYNCDDEEEREYPDKVQCEEGADGCEGDGWSDTIPACGEEGTFMDCRRTGAVCSEKNDGKKVQRCR